MLKRLLFRRHRHVPLHLTSSSSNVLFSIPLSNSWTCFHSTASHQSVHSYRMNIDMRRNYLPVHCFCQGTGFRRMGHERGASSARAFHNSSSYGHAGASTNESINGLSIHLNSAEERLVSIFAETAAAYNCDDCGSSSGNRNRNAHQNALKVRIAGGWVRDKLLGRVSNDIDIALEGMSGIQFAELVKAFLLESDSVTKPKDMSEGGAGELVSSIGVVKKNVEQSKHLECATMRIGEHSIDFVNLRKEDYSSTGKRSRIPSFQEMGTPAEDAKRRDFTINALFYNIHSQQIEDFNDGKGIVDLKNLVLRTPQSPLQTLLDDPLRAVRAVRFLSTLHSPANDAMSKSGTCFPSYECNRAWKLDEELAEALGHDAVAKALGQKVSRERIGIEMRKLMNGDRCFKGLDTLRKAGQGTSNAIFKLPALNTLSSCKSTAVASIYEDTGIDIESRMHAFLEDQTKWDLALASLEASISQTLFLRVLEHSSVEKWEMTTALVLSSLLGPDINPEVDADDEFEFASYVRDQYKKSTKFDSVGRDIATHVISQSWKMPNRSAKNLEVLLTLSRVAPWRQDLIDLVTTHLNENTSLSNEDLLVVAKNWSLSYVGKISNHIPVGLWMIKSDKQHWKAGLFLSVVSACQEAIEVAANAESCILAKQYAHSEILSTLISPLFLAFSEEVDTHPILSASHLCHLRPKLNGKEVQKLLEGTSFPPSSCKNIHHSKKYIGEALKALVAWQIQNPHASQSLVKEFLSHTWWPQFQSMHK